MVKISPIIILCYRTATARGKAEQSDEAADQAKEDCDIAQMTAKQFAPDFKHPGFDRIGLRDKYRQTVSDAPRPVIQESEKILDGKIIPNHIPPMHTQIPQHNKISNVTTRRPSNQYPRTVMPNDSRLANVASLDSDDRTLGPPLDAHGARQDGAWTQQMNSVPPGTDYSKLPHHNEQSAPYSSAPSAPPQTMYRMGRQEPAQHPPTLDQNTQMYNQIPQNRRISNAVKGLPNQRSVTQDWSVPPNIPPRRQSILSQPTYDQQTFTDGGATYGRNEYRGGTIVQGEVPERQLPRAEPQSYRTVAPENDMTNGAREARPPGARPSIDYFDHYKRPPSRDSSVDRSGRRSRQPSVEAPAPSGVGGSRGGSVAPQGIVSTSRPASRAATPAGNGHLTSGRGSVMRSASREPPQFEESLLRKRTLGQEISPSPYQPKRTESLYVTQNPAPPPPPVAAGGGGGGRKVSTYLVFQ